MKLIEHFVGGKIIPGSSDKKGKVFNPATGEQEKEVRLASSSDLDQAVEIAKKAFETWSLKPSLQRARIMFKFKELIEKNSDELTQLIVSEHGKVYEDAKGSLTRGLEVVEFACGIPHLLKGEFSENVGTDVDSWSMRQPLGVVAGITPFNFPAMVPMWMFPIAIACGNTFILKPSEKDPSCAIKLAELLKEAGLPDGVFNVITGSASEIGKELTSNPIVRKISFTGSTEVGKILLEQSASTVKKVSMELGGHAPFIVFDDADMDEAVAGALQSKFRNSGQTCICSNRIFVHENIYDEFLEKFTNEVSKITVGNGLEDGIVSGPLIDQSSLEKVIDHVQDAVNTGAKIAIGGDVHSLGGNFYQPTVLSNVSTKAKITFEETFGPVAPLYKFSSDDEVIKMANDTPYGLASYFYSRDIGRIWRVAEALEYGIVSINNGLPTIAEVPFGGVKESGMGREGSRYGLDDYLTIKYISMGGI